MKVKYLFSIIIAIISLSFGFGQNDISSYDKQILKHRDKYKKEFIRDTHAPLTKYDTNFLSFYDPDSNFKVNCYVTYLEDQPFFDFATSAGKKRKYRKFTMLNCPIQDTIVKLFTYESKRLLESEKYKDYIFLPFSDFTNGESTYGGGRYLDLSRDQFIGETIDIDFNKAYNPYCAYSTGYSCAIPPRENYINLEILAGEKIYKGEKKHRHK